MRKLISGFGWLLIALVILVIPTLFASLARDVLPLKPDAQGNLPGWFETAGQFGDHYGFLTCLAALAAASFALQSYLKQSRETLLAQRERHFFKLHDDIKEALARAREKGSEMESNKVGTQEIFEDLIESTKELANHSEWQSTTNDPEKVKAFSKWAHDANFLSIYNFREVVIRFNIAFKYLEEIESYEKPGTYRVYFDSLFATLTENEMKVISFMIIESEQRNGKAELEAFKHGHNALNRFSTLMYGLKLEEIESAISMSSENSMLRRIGMIRTVVKIMNEPEALKVQKQRDRKLAKMAGEPPMPEQPPSDQGSPQG